MKDALLLVFANKQDVQGCKWQGKCCLRESNVLMDEPAMKPKEVSDRLQLDNVAKSHTWKVEPSCATTGEGIFEGLVCLQEARRRLD